MRWTQIVLYSFSGVVATVFVFSWLLLQGVFDPPRLPKSLTNEQRQMMHPDTVRGIDAYVAGDYGSAVDLWMPRANSGDEEAQFRIGRAYATGDGLPKSSQNAVIWYERSAASGHRSALNNLGVMFETGDGVTPDIKKAIKYYEAAVNLGHPSSMVNLAQMYNRNTAALGGPKISEKLLLSAASMGCVSAYGQLSIYYMYSAPESDKSAARAIKWEYLYGSGVEGVEKLKHLFYLSWYVLQTTAAERATAYDAAIRWRPSSDCI
jgi:TPR repeat protein